MSKNRSEREAAEAKIKDYGIAEPSNDDILKYRLAEECNWHCPYCGKQISADNLFGAHPQFDIEHIIPYDRCLDDSFSNKTLCDVHENRSVKKNRTPYEAYHGTSKWDEIIGRVKRFKGSAARSKLWRFSLNEEECAKFISDFTHRQLNDTAWSSRWAKKYIGLLYGGLDDDGIDSAGKRRVQASNGMVTGLIRYAWGLNKILGKDDIKSRDDHRHHAIDALVIALTTPGTIKSFSDAAKRGRLYGNRNLKKVASPWPGFVEHVQKAIENITVSRRVSRHVRGALHEETFYRRVNEKEVVKRIPLSKLKAKDIDNICDPTVREIVRRAVKKAGGDPQKAFKEDKDCPQIENKSGKPIPILRVRMKDNVRTFPVGSDHKLRHVQSDRNHHMEVFAVTDDAGKEIKWDAEVVSMFEAYRRRAAREPIVKRDHAQNTKFLFSLALGETIKIDSCQRAGERQLCAIRIVGKNTQMRFSPLNDARKLADIPKSGHTAYPDSLRQRNCRKVTIDLLGRVRYAND